MTWKLSELFTKISKPIPHYVFCELINESYKKWESLGNKLWKLSVLYEHRETYPARWLFEMIDENYLWQLNQKIQKTKDAFKQVTMFI